MATAKKTEAKSGKKSLIITQKGSGFGQKPGMRETLIGLGLGKRHGVSRLEDTPSVRGMIYKVRHLVEVMDEK